MIHAFKFASPSFMRLAMVACFIWAQDLPAKTASHDTSQPHISVSLVAESRHLGPGETTRIGVLFKPEPHWHIYWQNPGDTGLAPTLEWRLPKGLELGDLQWPYPARFPIAHLTNYGYEDEVLLFATLKANQDFNKTVPLSLAVKLSWLVCRETCIPGKSSLSLTLNDIDEKSPDEAMSNTPLFKQWLAKVPEAHQLNGSNIELNQQQRRLSASLYANDLLFKDAKSVEVFVQNIDLVTYGSPITLAWDNNWIKWEQNLSDYFTGAPENLDLVIVVDRAKSYFFTIPF